MACFYTRYSVYLLCSCVSACGRTHLVGGHALVDAEVLAAQRVDGDVPAERAHAVLLQRQPVAAPPRHARPLRAFRLLRLAVHLYCFAHLTEHSHFYCALVFIRGYGV